MAKNKLTINSNGQWKLNEPPQTYIPNSKEKAHFEQYFTPHTPESKKKWNEWYTKTHTIPYHEKHAANMSNPEWARKMHNELLDHYKGIKPLSDFEVKHRKDTLARSHHADGERMLDTPKFSDDETKLN